MNKKSEKTLELHICSNLCKLWAWTCHLLGSTSLNPFEQALRVLKSKLVIRGLSLILHHHDFPKLAGLVQNVSKQIWSKFSEVHAIVFTKADLNHPGVGWPALVNSSFFQYILIQTSKRLHIHLAGFYGQNKLIFVFPQKIQKSRFFSQIETKTFLSKDI